jgi:hypothetical protein
LQGELEVEEKPFPLLSERRSDVGGGRGQPGPPPAGFLHRRPQLPATPLDALLVQGEEQLLLAREVRVDRSGGETRVLRDRLHGSAVEAATGEHPGGGSQQILADFLAGTSPHSLPCRQGDHNSIRYPIVFAIWTR